MEWTRVEDGLPIEGTLCAIYGPMLSHQFEVLTATFDGLMEWIDGETRRRFVTTWGRGTCEATHWMPMPAPPEMNK